MTSSQVPTIRLPFDKDSFDLVINTVSVDYMTYPFLLFDEINKVLKPGTGVLANTFSNRFFPTKVIKRWMDAVDNHAERVRIVGSYFAASSGVGSGRKEARKNPMWADIGGYELISPRSGGGDPLWVVQGRKTVVMFGADGKRIDGGGGESKKEPGSGGEKGELYG